MSEQHSSEQPAGEREPPAGEHPSSEHPGADALLDLALGADEPALRAHVAGCPACGEAYAGLEQEQAVLADALRAAPAPGGLEERVIAAVAATPTHARRRRQALWRMTLAIAAALLLSASAWLVLGRETPKQELIRQVRVSERKALGLEEAE